MHRASRIADFWDWLPTFRAIAETGSIRNAAARLHVAPSAISRTLRILEDALGHALFERDAGGLALTAEGRKLLDGVRAAMRSVDDAVSSAAPGPVHILCPMDLVAAIMIDVLESWSASNPENPPFLHVPCTDDVPQQLLRGDLDVALEFQPAVAPGLTSTLLGKFTSGIYGAPGAFKARAADASPQALSELPFVDYPVGALGFLRVMNDPGTQRAAYAPSMEVALRLASRGIGLVAAPDFVVERLGMPLERLSGALPEGNLYAWSRRALAGTQRSAFVAHLTSAPVFSSLVREPRAGRSRQPKSTRARQRRAR